MTASPRPSFPYLTEFADARPVSHLTSYAEALLEREENDVQTEGAELPQFWSGVIGVEGTLTGDGRIIENEALEWDTPIPLRTIKEDTGGHQGAVVAGRILSISRGDDGMLNAYGDFDLASDEGREAARLVRDNFMNGISMDLDSVAFEVRVAAEVIEADEAMWEALENGEEPTREVAEDGTVIVWKGSPNDEVMVTTAARVRAATHVSIPAFAEAQIHAVDELPEEIMALVASAAPVAPPEAWFANPELSGPTALTITDDGRVFGHLATWDVCHVADPSGAGVCVMAPKSQSNYAYFHTGAVKTAEGSQIPTGPIRFNTGHASLRHSAESAAAHYDNTGLAGADVHIGEDKHGIWVAGALRPGLSEEQVRTLRASPLSGDWRMIGGSFELVGALAVNLPGFPIPRTQGLVASGEMTSLVAAGMIAPQRALAVRQFSNSEAAHLRRLIERETQHEQRQLVQRGREAINRRKVEAMAIKLAKRG